MANSLNNLHHDYWASRVMHGFKNFGVIKKVVPWEVTVTREGEYAVVQVYGFYKRIRTKDRWWWSFTGKTWEGEVRKVQARAYQTAYARIREEENKDYAVSRLK